MNSFFFLMSAYKVSWVTIYEDNNYNFHSTGIG